MTEEKTLSRVEAALLNHCLEIFQKAVRVGQLVNVPNSLSNVMALEFGEELLVTSCTSLLDSASCIQKALSSMLEKPEKTPPVIIKKKKREEGGEEELEG